MAKKKINEVDVTKIKELEDVARGFEGSQGFCTLNSELADVYEKLGGNMEDVADTGNGSIEVPCEDLTNLMFEEPDVEDERQEGAVRSRTGKNKRIAETAQAPRMAPRPMGRSRLEQKLGERVIKESNTTGRVHRESVEPEGTEAAVTRTVADLEDKDAKKAK